MSIFKPQNKAGFKIFRVPSIIVVVLVLLLIAPNCLHITHTQQSGILEWFNKPAGVHYQGTHNRTYITWVNHEGRIEIRYYDHDTASMSDAYEIDNLNYINLECAVDDHNAPTVYVRDDGKIIVFYAPHWGGLYYKISTNAEDISSWGSRQTIEGGSEEACYPKPRKVGSDLWLFYRYKYSGNQRQEVYRISTSDGDSWGGRERLVEFASDELTIYMFIATSGNEIHLAWTTMAGYGGNQQIRNVYYMYSENSGMNWSRRDCTPITLPCTETEADLVFNSGQDQCYIWDLVLNANNDPFIVFAYKEDPDHEFRFARYDKGWSTYQITTSSQLYDASHFYSAGVVIDPNNVYQVYLSKKHEKLEIERWESSTNGQSWTKSASITSDSVKDNFRPQVIKDYHHDLILLWVYGDYTGLVDGKWTGWNTQIQSYPVANIPVSEKQ